MMRRQKLWFIAAIVFTIANLFGEVWAATRWEWIHASIHGVLLLVGVYGIWRFAPKRVESY